MPNISDIHGFHAASSKVAEQKSEIDRLRKATSTHIAAVRRHKVRESQLEDALLAVQKQVDASQDQAAAAEEAARGARTKTADAVRRQRAAEAAERTAKQELAQQADELSAVREESKAVLARLQDSSCDALRSAEAEAAARMEDISKQVKRLREERSNLQQELADLKKEHQAGDGQCLAVQRADEAASEVQELRQRNHQLQLALAAQSTGQHGARHLLEAVRILRSRFIASASCTPVK